MRRCVAERACFFVFSSTHSPEVPYLTGQLEALVGAGSGITKLLCNLSEISVNSFEVVFLQGARRQRQVASSNRVF